LDALIGLLGRTVLEVRIVGAGPGGVSARAGRIALQVPLAAVVAHARVTVEEAILLAGVDVVAGDPGAEASLVVVAGAGALRVGAVDQSVAVVVDAVAAGRRADGTARAGGATGSRGAAARAPARASRGAAPAARGSTRAAARASRVVPSGAAAGIGDAVALRVAGRDQQERAGRQDPPRRSLRHTRVYDRAFGGILERPT